MPQAGSRARPGLWGGVFVILIAAGAVCSLIASMHGVGSTLSVAPHPWRLCVGLDVFCGMALATGAFWIAFIAQLIASESWETVKTASVCSGCAAYAVAILGALADPGLKQRLWPTVAEFWSQRSVVPGSLWTFCLLALVLLLEFAPKMSRNGTKKFWLRPARQVQLLGLGTLAAFATMHQVGLARTLSLSQQTLWPFWSGPGLEVEFVASSFCAALAVLLFASWRSTVAFGKHLPIVISSGVGRLLSVAVFLYLAVRFTHFLERGAEGFAAGRIAGLLLVEVGLFFAGMVLVSAGERNPKTLYYGSAMIMAAIIANRLNTSITAVQSTANRSYRPDWAEIIIAYSLVAVGIVMFAVCVKHLPVFVDATEGD